MKVPKSMRASVGFRVKSGWATAVLLAGPIRSPRVLDCRIVELSDPAAPETRQPYHAKRGTLEEDKSIVRRHAAIVRRVTKKSVIKLFNDFRTMGYTLHRAALVVGSLIEPESIANPHIRAHAFEGQLFRTVLGEAVKSGGLPCFFVVDRDAYAKAAAILKRSESELRRTVHNLGKGLNGPWRAEEKIATLSAWMALA